MMKRKVLLTVITLFTATVGFAQDDEVLRSKKGHAILPEAGDLALGFNAVPLLNFALNAVNIMNNTGHMAQHPGYVNGLNQVISGKYFLSSQKAVRVRVGINSEKTTESNYGNSPMHDPAGDTPPNVLISRDRTASNNVLLGAGLEFRRGYNRLQGYYGGEVITGFASSRTSTSYKYSLEELLDAPNPAYRTNDGDTRFLSQRSGTSLTLGLRGFVGVEYFVAPKISIGAEFGWGAGITTDPRGSTKTESWTTSDGTTTRKVKGNTSSSDRGFGVDNGLGGTGALSVHFHF